MLRRSIFGGVIYMLAGLSAASSAEDLPLGVIGSLSGGGTDWGIATQRGAIVFVDEGGLRQLAAAPLVVN